MASEPRLMGPGLWSLTYGAWLVQPSDFILVLFIDSNRCQGHKNNLMAVFLANGEKEILIFASFFEFFIFWISKNIYTTSLFSFLIF